MKTFLERLEDPQPLILDGGFGSELFARGIELANSSLANEEYPEAVVDVHSAYIEAGADVIETNTFVATGPHLEMAGKSGSDADNLVRRAVELAREAVERSGKDIYVAGSVGPSPGAIEADSGGTDFGIPNRVVEESFRKLGRILAEGGVDFFCIETMFSAKEAAIAVNILKDYGLPIAVNLTYKFTKERKTGKVVYRTDWGHSAADLLEILSSGEFSGGYDLLESVQILGLNCGAESRRQDHTGMSYALSGIQQLTEALGTKGIRGKRLMAYPNAGIAQLDKSGRTHYLQTPEEMAGHLPELYKTGAYIVGGCCGTGPEHIKAFRRALDENITRLS